MSSETNPNVNISGDEGGIAAPQTSEAPSKGAPLSVGKGSISFDALDEKLGPSLKQFRDAAPKADAKAAEKNLATPEKEGEPVSGEQKAEPSKIEAVKDAIKKALKLKVGPRGRELELETDTKIPVTIDGQEQEISLDDLRSNYSGKVAYDKRFSELDQRDKTFLKDKEETEKQLTSILSKAYNKDPIGAILEMVDIAKLDPGPVFDSLKNEFLGDFTKFMQMSESERELHWAKKENEFLRRYKESADKAVESRQASEAQDSKLKDLRETLKMTDEWMSKAQAAIKDNPKAYAELAKKPEFTLELADAMRRWDMSTKVLMKVDPDFAKDPDMVEIGARKLTGHPGVTEEQATQMVLKALKLDKKSLETVETKKAVETLEKKVEDAETISKPAPSSRNKAYNGDDDFDPRGWGRL